LQSRAVNPLAKWGDASLRARRAFALQEIMVAGAGAQRTARPPRLDAHRAMNPFCSGSQSARGLAQSKTSRKPGSTWPSLASWSAAALCRFGMKGSWSARCISLECFCSDSITLTRQVELAFAHQQTNKASLIIPSPAMVRRVGSRGKIIRKE